MLGQAVEGFGSWGWEYKAEKENSSDPLVSSDKVLIARCLFFSRQGFGLLCCEDSFREAVQRLPHSPSVPSERQTVRLLGLGYPSSRRAQPATGSL